mmetsp:Transcript_15976/g.30065  ORF Transcript_15976/g.30065 Transcript_15976/m.30065 type:complete len:220 (+) Transcript_15976:49-708(+)
MEARRRSMRPALALCASLALGGWLVDAWARTFLLPQRGVAAGDALAGRTLHRPPRMQRAAGAARQAEADAAAEGGVRVGLIHVPELKDKAEEMKAAFEKLNVTNATYFQTEVPEAEQVPFASKLLAMSQTVDVVVAAHGLPEENQELLRAFQTVALTTNVPIVSCYGEFDISKKADTAVQMAEIRQQALMAGGPRRSIFFGIGKNKTAGDPNKKGKIYF